MTKKQQRFCKEYLLDLNATQAAVRAGYSAKTAYSLGNELLKKPEIKKYIEEQLEALKCEKIASAKEVLEYLTAVMRGEQSEQVPLMTGGGAQKLVQKEIGAKDRLKAAELLGKRYALFSEKLELQGETAVKIVDDIPAQEGVEND